MTALELPALPARLAVAVSGGADSMALTLLASHWAKANEATLYGLTVDHGIRPESAEEARQVKDWLAQRDIPCEILQPDAPITGANLQEKARLARYHAMAGWCAAHEVKHLLLAHHANDQLETVLMRLVRACGVEGLAGMRPVSTQFGLTLLRPLLGVAKARLIATLQAQGQAWSEDPSNTSPAFLRNRLRPIASALAQEGLGAERIHLLTSQLAETADFLAQQTQAWLALHVQRERAGIIMPLDVWQQVPREIGWRALRQLLMEVGQAPKPPRAENLLPLFEALARGALVKPRTLAGCILQPDGSKNCLKVKKEA